MKKKHQRILIKANEGKFILIYDNKSNSVLVNHLGLHNNYILDAIYDPDYNYSSQSAGEWLASVHAERFIII